MSVLHFQCTRRGMFVFPAAMIMAGLACVPPDQLDSSSKTDQDLRAALTANEVVPLPLPTTDEAQVRLGQLLFFDKILSGNRNISCATCHSPLTFSGDALSLSIGQGGVGLAETRQAPIDDAGHDVLIPRNAPELFHRAYMDTIFWDGRVIGDPESGFTSPAGEQLLPGLESALAVQAMFPVTSRDEMRGHAGENEIADVADSDFRGMWGRLMDRLLAIDEYVDLFAAAYPGTPTDELSFAHVANAIAAFEIATCTFDDAPFDLYLRGDDSALSAAEKRGALLFYGKADCVSCHSGALLSDQQFHNRGVPQIGPGKGDGDTGLWDFGRGRETGLDEDLFDFRTPPLRNVALTGPWMHSGAYATLAAAVRHCMDPVTAAERYDATQLSGPAAHVFRPEHTATILAAMDSDERAVVELTDAEFADLLAFLHALTSPSAFQMGVLAIPDEVPSGLPLAD